MIETPSLAQVFDGLFDDLFIAQMHEKCELTPVTATAISNKSTYPYGYVGQDKMLGATFFRRGDRNRFYCPIPNYDLDPFYGVFEKIEKTLGMQLQLNVIQMNMQPYECHGGLHVDSAPHQSSYYTILWMVNQKWEKEWGGEFEIYTDDGSRLLEAYDYIPGRVIVFPSYLLHRGRAPEIPNVYRMMMVFRVQRCN